jgi:hypothetical protein
MEDASLGTWGGSRGSSQFFGGGSTTVPTVATPAQLQAGLRKLRNTRLLAAGFLCLVGIAITLGISFHQNSENKTRVIANFLTATDSCASALRTSFTLTGTAFMHTVGGLDASQSQFFHPSVFKEAAVGMFR